MLRFVPIITKFWQRQSQGNKTSKHDTSAVTLSYYPVELMLKSRSRFPLALLDGARPFKVTYSDYKSNPSRTIFNQEKH